MNLTMIKSFDIWYLIKQKYLHIMDMKDTAINASLISLPYISSEFILYCWAQYQLAVKANWIFSSPIWAIGIHIDFTFILV